MSFHLLSLPAADAERLAYSEGFTGTAELFARLADMQKALGDATAALHRMRGKTPLIAAMRCYVASKLGDEVEIPEEIK